MLSRPSLLFFLSLFSLDASDCLIHNVTVIDVHTGAELPRRSILIHGNKIAAVGSDVSAPAGAEIVSGRARKGTESERLVLQGRMK